MPKRKTPELKPEEQFKRFVETAEKLGVDQERADNDFKQLAKVSVRQGSKARKS